MQYTVFPCISKVGIQFTKFHLGMLKVSLFASKYTLCKSGEMFAVTSSVRALKDHNSYQVLNIPVLWPLNTAKWQHMATYGSIDPMHDVDCVSQ